MNKLRKLLCKCTYCERITGDVEPYNIKINSRQPDIVVHRCKKCRDANEKFINRETSVI